MTARRAWRHAAWLAAGTVALTRTAAAQRFDTVAVRRLAPGVRYLLLSAPQGPWNVNVVEADLRQPGLSVRAERADHRLFGRERVSDLVHDVSRDSVEVIAAINADFFNLRTGENENNQVVEGEIWKALPPRGRAAVRPRTQFGLTWDARAVIAPLSLVALASSRSRGTLRVQSINAWGDSDDVVFFTSRFGGATPPDSGRRNTVAFPLRILRRHLDTVVARVGGTAERGGTATLALGAALVAGGRSRDALMSWTGPGDTVTIVARFEPAPAPLRTLVGGWPRLVVHGRSVADSADRLEATMPAFSVIRHPRTGIGVSRDSTVLFLVTVDGRQESSSGMSLVEFANLMLQLGIHEGVNLDGGGSTTMVIDGKVVNHPSDPGGERTVGNAILLVEARHE